MKEAKNILRDSTLPGETPSHSSAEKPPEGEKRLRLADFADAEHLSMLTGASGFTFAEDPYSETIGYTNMQTKRIYINPEFLPKYSPEALNGFLDHEAGHHAKEPVKFQEGMLNRIEKMEVPDEYKGTPTSQERFKKATWRNLGNGLADVFLESYMGRTPYGRIQDNIRALYGDMSRDWLKNLSKPEQLIQYMVGEARFDPDKPASDFVDKDVADTYKRLEKSGAIKTLNNVWAYQNPFAAPKDQENAMKKRLKAYDLAFLPEYMSLMEKELEKRKEQKQQQKGQPGEGQQGEGQGVSSAVPLTAEEEQEIVEQLLEELEKAGEQFDSKMPSKEGKKRLKDFTDAVRKQAQQGDDESQESDQGEQEGEGEKESGAERLRKASEKLAREREESNMRGTASANQVRQESVQHWKNTKEKYYIEIESMASNLADIFIDDRRKKLEFLKREGEIVPGLEYETVSALLSGELDPDTRMKTVRNPEFLETEIEFLVDTSGSMSGDKLDKAIDTMVITTEAFKKVQEDLVGENLLMDDEHPFRIGVTKFETEPERVTKLEEPLTDKKQLKIIDKVSEVGGGTDETGAIKDVSDELTKHRSNIIKMMIVLTDGYGDREGVAPILDQIEQDDEIILLAMGLGSKEEVGGVIDTYQRSAGDDEGKNSNIFADIAEEPEQIQPKVIGFIKGQVEKRRPYLY